jgi:hypothetical protein
MFSYESALRRDRTAERLEVLRNAIRRKPKHLGDERLHRQAAERPPGSRRFVAVEHLVKRAVPHDEAVSIVALDGKQQQRVRVAVEDQQSWRSLSVRRSSASRRSAADAPTIRAVVAAAAIGLQQHSVSIAVQPNSP